MTANIQKSPLFSPSNNALGKTTSYFAKPKNKDVSAKKNLAKPENKEEKKGKVTKEGIAKLKYDYKKANIERKKKIGKDVQRVGNCGISPISKYDQYINVVQGEKGGIYYNCVQRCGSVWLCPDCMCKLMKTRAEELYKQLKAYKIHGKIVLFVTFTLQHKKSDHLRDLQKRLLNAFQFANSHRSWIEAKKTIPVEYLRALEVLMGSNGWHPHLHCVFVGNPEIINTINIFVNLYKQYLLKHKLLVNKHTVVVEKWNGKLDNMKDYLFKGMLEKEITGGNLAKSGKGKNFFELIDEGNEDASYEFIKVMKGKRQYHKSKNFFKDVRVKDDSDILKDDVAAFYLYQIHKPIYEDMRAKGIVSHFLNEYIYGGQERGRRLLELYDCDTGFMGDPAFNQTQNNHFKMIALNE